MSTQKQYLTTRGTLADKYGVNKYELGYLMRNFMHVDSKYLLALSEYYMAHMPGEDFLVSDGTIEYKSHRHHDTYDVIYHQCNPFAAKRAKELRLSFRAAKPEFDLRPIVLVQIVSP